MAPGQLPPGAAGWPRRGIPWDPLERFWEPQAHQDVPKRYFPAPGCTTQCSFPKTRLREREKLWDAHGPRASWSCPWSPPGTQGWSLSSGRAVRGGCHPRRAPPRLWESFQASRWGRRRRRGAEKAIFSRYIFYKSNILCVSAFACKSISVSAPGLGGGDCESTEAGGDVAAAGGGGPPTHRDIFWGPLHLWASSTQPEQNICCSVLNAATGGFIPQGGGYKHTLLLPSCLTLLEIKYPG